MDDSILQYAVRRTFLHFADKNRIFASMLDVKKQKKHENKKATK